MRAPCSRRVIPAALALAAVSSALGACCGDALGGEIGGFGVRPAHFDEANPATRAYFIRTLKPGGTFSDQVVVSNGGGAPIRLAASAVDGLTAKTSGAVYANRSDRRFKAAAWVKLTMSSVTVPAHGQALVPFTVQAPRNALPGDHLAGIDVETRRPPSRARFSVTEVIRAVVGVLVIVPGHARARLTLGAVSLAPLPGLRRASVVVAIGNTGRKLCKPKLRVALGGPRSYHRTVVAQLDTILPGDTIPYPLPWPSVLRSGTYHSSEQASCRGTTAASTRSSLRLGSQLDGPTSARPVRASHGGGTPVWVFVAIALGSAGLGGALSRRRAGRNRPQASS
jgi:hypothetical protein